MEKPYAGRATITNNYGSYEIVIPAKRMWFIMIFLGAWLCGWVFGEVFAIGAIFGGLGFGDGFGEAGFANLFLLFWVTAWTAGGIFVLRILVWMLIGKEIITIGQGRITVHKKGLLFSKAKTYDVYEIKNMRTNAVSLDTQVSFGGFGRRRSMKDLIGAGAISFDYGLKTVTFASGIDTAEATYILKTLRSAGQLHERNFENNPHQSGFHNH